MVVGFSQKRLVSLHFDPAVEAALDRRSMLEPLTGIDGNRLDLVEKWLH
jgi:hypothetical protein